MSGKLRIVPRCKQQASAANVYVLLTDTVVIVIIIITILILIITIIFISIAIITRSSRSSSSSSNNSYGTVAIMIRKSSPMTTITDGIIVVISIIIAVVIIVVTISIIIIVIIIASVAIYKLRICILAMTIVIFTIIISSSIIVTRCSRIRSGQLASKAAPHHHVRTPCKPESLYYANPSGCYHVPVATKNLYFWRKFTRLFVRYSGEDVQPFCVRRACRCLKPKLVYTPGANNSTSRTGSKLRHSSSPQPRLQAYYTHPNFGTGTPHVHGSPTRCPTFEATCMQTSDPPQPEAGTVRASVLQYIQMAYG